MTKAEHAQNLIADIFRGFIGPKELPTGMFLCLCSEPTIKVLKPYFLKELVVGNNCFKCSPENHKFSSWIEEALDSYERIFIIVERMISGRNFDSYILELCHHYGDNLKIEMLVISPEQMESNKLTLWHERGVNNFVYYPVTLAKLTERIAMTIQPDHKLLTLKKTALQLLRDNRAKEALPTIREMIAIDANHPATQHVKGEYLLAGNNLDTALACFQQAIDSSPGYMEPLRRMSDVLKEAGRSKEALPFLKKLDQLSPLNYDRKLDIGTIHAKEGDLNEASQWIKAALETAKAEKADDIRNMELAITALIQPEKSKEAKRALLRAGIGVDYEMAAKLNLEGRLLREGGDAPGAMKKYQEALSYSPLDEKILFNLARAYEDTHRNRQMLVMLREVLDLNKNFGEGDETITRILANMFYNSISPSFPDSERVEGEEKEELLEIAITYYQKYLAMIEKDPAKEAEKKAIIDRIGEIKAQMPSQ